MEIIFKYSPLWLLLIVPLAAGLSMLLYYRNNKFDYSSGLQRFLALLRFLAFTALGLFLLNPMIKHSLTELKKPALVLLTDNSASMVAQADSAGVRQACAEVYRSLYEHLGKHYDIIPYAFGKDYHKGFPADFEEQSTNISSALTGLSKQLRHKNISAFILMSDGIFNAGTNPLYAAQQLQAPLFCLAFGDTNRYRDIRINSLITNKVVYLGDRYPVEVEVEARNCSATKSTLSISLDGRTVKEFTILPRTPYMRKKFTFTLKADQSGIKKLAAYLTPLPGERITVNNKKLFYFEVLENRSKILIAYHSPHPDIGALRRSLTKNGNYEVELKPLSALQSIKKYNLVIFHNLPARPAELRSMQNLLGKAPTPYLLVVGKQCSLPLLHQLNGAVEIRQKKRAFNEAAPVANPDFSFFTLDSRWFKTGSNYPPILVPFGEYRLPGDMQTALYQKIGAVKTSYPLLCMRKDGNKSFGFLFGEGWWRWPLYEYGLYQNSESSHMLFGKTVKLLLSTDRKEHFNSDYRHIINEGEALTMRFTVLNKIYEPLTSADVKVTIINADNKEFVYSAAYRKGFYLLNAGKFPAGEYRFKAVATHGAVSYHLNGRFVIKDYKPELSSLRAKHHLLQEMAEASGGRLFYPADADRMPQTLAEMAPPHTIKKVRYRFSPLIDLYSLLFILMALLSVEWFVRKYAGGY